MNLKLVGHVGILLSIKIARSAHRKSNSGFELPILRRCRDGVRQGMKLVVLTPTEIQYRAHGGMLPCKCDVFFNNCNSWKSVYDLYHHRQKYSTQKLYALKSGDFWTSYILNENCAFQNRINLHRFLSL